jgi:membrane-bound metal-dependent hydrolase YbcI (DUF457 family)
VFIGHFAVAFGAKKVAPRMSLGTLFITAQFIDLLWPLLLLLGLEHARVDPGNTAMTPMDFYDYPISHGLPGVLFWSLLVGGIYFAVRRYARGAVVAGLAVLSHWLLDLLTHRPDLPLGFGSEVKLGLGLWNSPVAAVALELVLYGAGVALYVRATEKKDGKGMIGLWGLVGVLLVIYAMNLAGPPPPDISVVAIAGNLTWLFVLWAFWVDAHRRLRER